MIGWSAFMYVSQKILHLRMSKVRIYYSHRLCLAIIFNMPWRAKGESEVADVTFSEAQESLLFDWFNCNPIHVLKSQFGVLTGTKVTESSFMSRGPRKLYRHGKQHLQIDDFYQRRRRFRTDVNPHYVPDLRDMLGSILFNRHHPPIRRRAAVVDRLVHGME
ncbi:hypothetical protein Pmar_PMAR028653 [Perkinsus marinus ATCC 50983]|uniref:Uncharacterized protein n=1 Tax=Perkinsus marinus (strain ATCC 50983 / TXsc) TaxID=423536 RepID=C5K8I1_PERM5|nr:hypothetical protein Pmar_PMAR028653 [Perkinsus marinus ATCC 50983]EER19188.1 hypothetical protein Pmar_PMAR028653 [Perkinsus marinus ATCC 50983]|eukprot:XP_002787392.1 hypothetical protein Pmar_PMAR028653 [Perkinsus marinus ATCC 50983]